MSPATPARSPSPAKPAVSPPPKPRRLKVGTGPQASWLLAHAAALGVGFSVFAHCVLLATNFIAPDSGLRKERDMGLQVVLVNAKHKRAPKDPQALAQANLDGGGDQDDKKAMPTSPLPPQEEIRDGEALVAARQRTIQQLEAQQREMMTRAKASDAKVNADRQTQQTEQPTDQPPVQNGLDMSTARAIARQEAVVDKSLSDYAKRPKKGVISPLTKEYKLAQYGEDWRIKVQRVGELNFPRSAKGSLYGSVMVSVEINPEGRVLSAEIVRPNENPKINEAALLIVKRGSPYAPFTPELRREYDVLVLTRTMNFTREDISVNSQ